MKQSTKWWQWQTAGLNEKSKSQELLVSLGDFSSVRHSYVSVVYMVHHACLKCYVLEPQMLTVIHRYIV